MSSRTESGEVAISEGRVSAKFFDERRYWSGIKHRILADYIQVYLKKRGGTKTDFFFVDGFAGRGSYGSGATYELGSPIIMWELAESLRNEGKGNRLHCINVERDRDHYLDLSAALARADPSTTKVFHGSLADHHDDILKLMDGHPAICFLDPYGVVGVEFDEMSPIFRRPDTEILINFSTPTLVRLAGFEDSQAKDAQKKVARVSITLGEDPLDPNPMWLQKLRECSDSSTWVCWVIKQYMKRVMEVSPELRHALAYPVRKSWDGREKYYLLFASRSRHAFPLMNDFVYREDDRLYQEAEAALVPAGQMSFISPVLDRHRQQRFVEGLEALPDEIYDQREPLNGRSVEFIIQEKCLEQLARFQQKQYRGAVRGLVKQHRATYGPGEGDKRIVWFS